MERGAAGEVLALLRRFEGRVDLESRSAIAMLRVAAPSARSAPGDSTARIVAVIDHLGAVHGACAAHERELVKAIKVLRSHGDASVVTIAKALLQRSCRLNGQRASDFYNPMKVASIVRVSPGAAIFFFFRQVRGIPQSERKQRTFSTQNFHIENKVETL